MSAIQNPRFDPTPSVAPPHPAPVAAAPEPAKGKPWKWLILLVVLGIGGFVAYDKWAKPKPAEVAGTPGAPVQVKTARVSTGSMEQTVRISGPTSSLVFQNIIAPILRGPEGGREMILLYLIQSGTRVKKGQLIAQIDAKTMEDHIEDIGDDIEKADADIRKRKAEQAIDMANLTQSIRVTKADLDKATWEAKATEVRTPIDQELMKLTVDEATARYKQAQADIAQKQIVQGAELTILGITRERHVRHRDKHKIDLTKFTIYSPLDGLAVVQMTFRSSEMATIQQGDQVQPGQIFMKVVDPSKMQIEGTINQAESGMFRINQPAAVSLDAFPDLKMTARIYSIAAIATGGFRQNYFIRSIPVRLLINGSDPRLIPDLSAAADVVVGHEDNVKKVPLAAVFNENGKEVVFVKTPQGFQKREVALGLKSNTYAAVTNGLGEGDEVAIERPHGT